MTTLIRNGTVCLEDRLARADVLVQDGTVAQVGERLHARPDDEVDAAGLYVLPGLIDIHTHVDDRIGLYDLADSYESGTRVAVENGITTIFTFVTQQPGQTLADAIGGAVRKAEGHAHAHVMWHLTPTKLDADGMREVREWIKRGFRTIKLYTTYKRAGIFSDEAQTGRLFAELTPLGVQFLVHCEDEAVLEKAQAKSVDVSDPHSHALLRPPQAETEAIRKVLAIAERHHARVHIVHVSTPEGLDLIAKARSRVQVTCETAPHYLFLNEDRLRGAEGNRWVCSPPLRPEPLRAGLEERARAGKVDIYATDHCAFRREHKDAWHGDVRDIPNGLPGIGALPHVIMDLYRDGFPDSLVEFARRLSTNPAKVTGLYPRKGTIIVGSDADLLLLRTDGAEHQVRSTHADSYEPYPGRMSRLTIERVLMRGETVVRDGMLADPVNPKGQCLCQW